MYEIETHLDDLLQPFLDVSGELIRKNGIENLTGVNMIMDLQLIDVNNCEPVKGMYVEFWQANQTVSALDSRAGCHWRLTLFGRVFIVVPWATATEMPMIPRI